MAWSKEQVEALASPLIRKYDWKVTEIEGGVKLTVNDGKKTSSLKFIKDMSTTLADEQKAEVDIQALIDKVDKHQFVEETE